MPEIKDLAGQQFGDLTVVSLAGRKSNGHGAPKTYWKCLCSCGETKEVAIGNLRSGQVKSCGCHRKRVLNKTIHGLSDTSSYVVWRNMLHRCTDPRDTSFHNYGGRGIRVSDRWEAFENFYSDMGERPEGTSLDRIDNNGPYSKENCRWAPIEVQANNKRCSRLVTYQGKTLSVSQWASELGISRYTLYSRLNSLPAEVALSMPVGPTSRTRG
jgi:hypothetical protein